MEDQFLSPIEIAFHLAGTNYVLNRFITDLALKLWIY